MPGSEFQDQVGGQGGTPIASAELDALVVSTTCIITGGLPSGTAGLTVSLPATAVVINTNGTALYVPASGTVIPAAILTMSPNVDNYVDLTAMGTYIQSTTSIGGLSPVLALGAMRLFKATTNGTAVTVVTPLASTAQVIQTQVAVDTVEAATNDTLSSGSTLLTNLNRIRNSIAAINTTLSNGLSGLIPFSQKGTANGVASLDTQSRVVQRGTHGVMQVAYGDQGFQDILNLTSTTWTPYAGLPAPFLTPRDTHSDFFIHLAGTFANTSSSTQMIKFRAEIYNQNGVAGGVPIIEIYLGGTAISPGERRSFSGMGVFVVNGTRPNGFQIQMQYIVDGGTFQCRGATSNWEEHCALFINEVIQL